MTAPTLVHVLLAGLLGPSLPGPAPASAAPGGKVFLTVPEALELAFPDCRVERTTVFLDAKQRERAAELAGFEVDERIVHPYVATVEGELVGTAYFDAHKVRTLKETVMFVVAPDYRIRRFELLAFAEPLDYVPRESWYAQFVGKRLDEDLNLKRGIKGVTGATLTARATTRAARRVLALHEALHPRPAPEEEEEEGEKKKKKKESEKEQGKGGNGPERTEADARGR